MRRRQEHKGGGKAMKEKLSKLYVDFKNKVSQFIQTASTQKKAVILILVVCLFGGVYMLVKDDKDPHRDKQLEFNVDKVRQITKISDIEDRSLQSKLINAIAKGESILYNGETGYVILYTETDKEIRITEGKEYDRRNTIEVIYELGEQNESKEISNIHIFEVPGIGTNYLVANTKTPLTLSGIREIISIKRGDSFRLIDAKTGRDIDANVKTWYGEGLFIGTVSENENRYKEIQTITLPDGKEEEIIIEDEHINPFKYVISNADRINVVQTEAIVMSEENRDGLVKLDLGNGYIIEAKSTDNRLLQNMKYKINLIYTSSGFKFSVEEILFKPERRLEVNE